VTRVVLGLLSAFAVAGLFLFADPVVTAVCTGSSLAACEGMGGRFALVTLLRAAVGLPIVAAWRWRASRWPDGDRAVRWPAAAAIVTATALSALLYERLSGGSPEFVVEVCRTARPSWLLVVAMLAAAPLFEESLFRGLMFDWVAHLGLPLAIVVTALAWVSVHGQYDVAGTALLLWMGILLAGARAVSGGLALPVALHAAWNLRALMVAWPG
jgi:membrane protease YdiL (CAAX protease family)